VFDERAKIITEHQTEFNQILPHAGWHEQDPEELVSSMRECINRAVEKLEWMGWEKSSVKGIGRHLSHNNVLSRTLVLTAKGITNQRETTLCWSRSTGKPLCNAIVWDDARTVAVVRQFEKKLDEDGIDIDDEEADAVHETKDGIQIGTGGEDAAFSDEGNIANGSTGVVNTIGKAMESLGLAGKGKDQGRRRRKGKDGLVDM
jgi:glycerol kinase